MSQAWWYFWMIAAMMTKQVLTQVLHYKALVPEEFCGSPAAHLSNSVLTFADRVSPGGKFVNDHG